MSLKVDDISSHVCNVTRLDLLLNLTSTKVSISDLSKSLCGIGEDKAVAMVESMLQNMDLGKLVQEVQENEDSENILVAYCTCNTCVNWLLGITLVFIDCLI